MSIALDENNTILHVKNRQTRAALFSFFLRDGFTQLFGAGSPMRDAQKIDERSFGPEQPAVA
jgi:hypothetical protein